MAAALKLKTLQDVLLLDPEVMERCELINGEISQKSMASGNHADVESSIAIEVGKRFKRPKGPDGSVGWWIKTEVSVFYPKHENMFVHDLAGWKRDRVPVNPMGYPVKDRPDWVCEVCATTWKKDTLFVPDTLALAEVPFYWVADVERECLLVFKLNNGKYSLIQNLFRTDTKVRIEPFESVELNVDVFFGADAED
jgi:Uma2 family endonuclease